MTPQQKAYTALTVTSIVWGTTWVAMKLGVQGMPPLQLAAIRQCIGGCLFVGFFSFYKKMLPTKAQLQQLFITSIFTFVLANGFATLSLQYIPSGLSALIAALYPLCVVIIEYFLYKNKGISWLSFVGIILGFGGIGVVFYENAFATHATGYVLGVGLSLLSMLAWSCSTILIARNKINVNPYMGIGWQMLFSSGMLYTLSWFTHKNIAVTAIPLQSWLAIAYLVVLGSIITMLAFVYTMKHLPTAVAALYAYINPIVAILIGTILLGEHLTLAILLGSAITLLGVYLVKSNTTPNKLN